MSVFVVVSDTCKIEFKYCSNIKKTTTTKKNSTFLLYFFTGEGDRETPFNDHASWFVFVFLGRSGYII